MTDIAATISQNIWAEICSCRRCKKIRPCCAFWVDGQLKGALCVPCLEEMAVAADAGDGGPPSDD